MYALPPADCIAGYPRHQVEQILTKNERSLDEFFQFMEGQTVNVCDGQTYDHPQEQYYPNGCGPHGFAYNKDDMERFLKGLPVID